jgi:signal transduction histidine kinase
MSSETCFRLTYEPIKMKLTDRAFNRLVLLVLATGFAALIVVGLMAVWTLSRNQDQARLIKHAYQVNATLGRYQIQLERAETARRGYLLDRSALFENQFTASTEAAAAALDVLKTLVRDTAQQQRYVRLRALTRDEIAAMERSMRLVRAGDLGRAQAMFDEGRNVRALFAIRLLSEDINKAQNALLAQRKLDEQSSLAQLYLVLAGAGLLLLLVGVGSGWAIRRYTTDLAGSRDQLRDLNASLEGAVDERTADLQRANDEIQRFAYIISHDLRAPLVNITGFTAELESATKLISDYVNRSHERAPGDVPANVLLAAREDLPEATDFIRSSAQKMDRLITAILRLAREGRRLLNPEQLQINALVRTVTDSLEHRLGERGATIEVQQHLPDIVNDRVAVEQLFSNLLENAVKYLDPARPGAIFVRGERRGDRAVFEVIDNGRGIDPRDHQRIFDLFRRSGVQDQQGEGIGLAHARALAYRLGGTIGCESKLGEGAIFTLSLPATYHGERTES